MTESIQRSTRKRPAARATSTGVAQENLRAQGVRTRKAILRVARKLLLQSGSLEFSLRAVASGAGISISNLQYYFPNRAAVLRAVVEPTLSQYAATLREAVENTSSSPQESLDLILEQTVKDAKDEQRTTIWSHFISLASTDPECAKLLEEWYEVWTDTLAKLIRALNPKWKGPQCMINASLVVALADGMFLRLGAGRHERLNVAGLEAGFASAVRSLVQGDSMRPAGH